MKKFRNFFDKTSEKAQKSIRDTTDKTMNLLDDVYQKTKLKDAVDFTTENTGKHLDNVSGQKMYQLVEERLMLQDQYNNILATKLEEALNKIKALEDRISNLENSN